MYKQRKLRQNSKDQLENSLEKLKQEFDSMPWASRIDERIDPEELESCIRTLTEFYKQQAELCLE